MWARQVVKTIIFRFAINSSDPKNRRVYRCLCRINAPKPHSHISYCFLKFFSYAFYEPDLIFKKKKNDGLLEIFSKKKESQNNVMDFFLSFFFF